MSKLAQAVQQQVHEMRKAAQQSTKRRQRMDGDRDVPGDDPGASGEPNEMQDVTDAISDVPPAAAEQQEQEQTMTKKKSTKSTKKKSTAPPKERTAKKATAKGAGRTKKPKKASAKTTSGPRQHKTYTLVDGIPETLRNPSSGRSILESIETRGTATADDIRGDHPKYPDATIRFYLGKFQRTGILTGK